MAEFRSKIVKYAVLIRHPFSWISSRWKKNHPILAEVRSKLVVEYKLGAFEFEPFQMKIGFDVSTQNYCVIPNLTNFIDFREKCKFPSFFTKNLPFGWSSSLFSWFISSWIYKVSMSILSIRFFAKILLIWAKFLAGFLCFYQIFVSFPVAKF
jgi:hypothetical protein